jgi:hypothetical protein
MVMKFYNNSNFDLCVGEEKTIHDVVLSFFFGPGVRVDVFGYVIKCWDCQRAKPVQSA